MEKSATSNTDKSSAVDNWRQPQAQQNKSNTMRRFLPETDETGSSSGEQIDTKERKLQSKTKNVTGKRT